MCTFQGCVKPSPFFSTIYGKCVGAVLNRTDMGMCGALSMLL